MFFNQMYQFDIFVNKQKLYEKLKILGKSLFVL